jgi:hypothetical protein
MPVQRHPTTHLEPTASTMLKTFSLSAAFFLSLGLMMAFYAQVPLA